MVKVVIIFHSLWGHAYEIAKSIQEGANSVSGVSADIYQVVETLPKEILEKMHAQKQLFKDVPAIDYGNQERILKEADAVIIGGGTRFGVVSAQLKTFIDGLGQLWQQDALVGKVGSGFCGTASQHGGQETTIFTIITPLLHLGFAYVGLPYTAKELFGVKDVNGGSPYGVTYLSDGDGSRPVSDREKSLAKFQGKHVAQFTHELVTGRGGKKEGAKPEEKKKEEPKKKEEKKEKDDGKKEEKKEEKKEKDDGKKEKDDGKKKKKKKAGK